jgi:amino acid transporter
LNYFGPKHTGGLAFLVSVPTAIVVTLLGLFTLPHLGQAVHNLKPLSGGFLANWNGFVGIVLALSGVEAIANATSVMKLNPGSSDDHPNVSKTSTPAIAWVMLEVCLLTALLGLGMNALGGLQIHDGDVNAPGNPGVRDFMLKYMAQIFVGGAIGPLAGHIAGLIVSFVIGFLLLSAVNTAIVDLIAISFLMSRDGELPSAFEKLNQFGVPTLGLMVAMVIPAILVVVVRDMAGLADLYAVGVCGAIATNLGATSTDRKLDLARWERSLMFITFLVMAGIEISLFIDKPNARLFAATVLVFGLILRGLVSERAQKKELQAAAGNDVKPSVSAFTFLPSISETSGPPVLCAVRGRGRTLDFGIQYAKETNRPLYILYVREQPVLTSEDRRRKWAEDQDARDIFVYAKEKAGGHTVLPCYAVSDAAAETIVDIAATVGASQLILGAPERNLIVNLLRGNIIRNISSMLPDEIDLLVYA